jgi:hypothetical protein
METFSKKQNEFKSSYDSNEIKSEDNCHQSPAKTEFTPSCESNDVKSGMEFHKFLKSLRI